MMKLSESFTLQYTYINTKEVEVEFSVLLQLQVQNTKKKHFKLSYPTSYNFQKSVELLNKKKKL